MTQLRSLATTAALSALFSLGLAGSAVAKPEKKPRPADSAASHAGHNMGSAAMPMGAMAAMPAVYGGDADKPGAPVFTGLGDHRHPITTKNAETQKLFDQGVRLLFGFNHAEAIRSFREAARLDPDCAMCWWGVAFALGPNINLPMQGDAAQPAWQALGRAQALAPKASPAEQAYVAALARRYTTDPKADRKPLDEAFAVAMAEVARAYPDDLDAATFAAEAMMDTQPWDYWEADAKTPKGHGGEIVGLLEGVLAKSPNHPGALHLYIHAVEASNTPERAEAAADRLLPLMPQAGHIVHMPSHIYYRVGRYADAVKVNEQAATVDEQYIAQCKAQGFYPVGYYGHNIHFLWTSSEMLGRSAAALDASRRLVKAVNAEAFSKTVPVGELFVFTPVATLVRFGRWREVLAEPAPPGALKLDTAVWLYAQAFAHANTGDRKAALADREKLAALASADLSAFDPFGVPAKPMVNLALALADGEIARTSGNLDGAVARFRQGWELERALPYTEPPYWHRPTSHVLGAALLQANRPKEAEAVYRESLTYYRGDGWALFGLAQALEAQGRKDEAAKTRAAFDEAWKMADVKLTASRF
jgi:tetratricopeptide (TPR) repeat protein